MKSLAGESSPMNLSRFDLHPVRKDAAQPIWASTVVPTQQDFINLVRDSRRALSTLAQDLADRLIDAREWGERFKRILNASHAQAYTLGRQRAGDLLSSSVDDVLAGVAAADTEADFLLAFIDAIQEGDLRYFDDEGNLKVTEVARRSRMYTGALRGTTNEAWANALPGEQEIFWRLGAVEEHCTDCPELAALNPFTRDTLFQKPGDNQTPCLFHCRCWLETIDDDGNLMSGFKPVL